MCSQQQVCVCVSASNSNPIVNPASYAIAQILSDLVPGFAVVKPLFFAPIQDFAGRLPVLHHEVTGYDKYPSHAVVVFTTSVTMVRRMRLTASRRDRLNKHSNEWQAAKK
jgi:hypothetical protein